MKVVNKSILLIHSHKLMLKMRNMWTNKCSNTFQCKNYKKSGWSTGVFLLYDFVSLKLFYSMFKLYLLEVVFALIRKAGCEKVAPVKLATFVSNPKKSLSKAHKVKSVYEEESAVIRNLYFVQNLDEDKKVEAFSHEWTSCPASLFESDPSLDQGYAMRKGNKADFLAAMKTSLGSSWTEMERLPLSNMSVVLIVDAMAFIQRHQHLEAALFMNCKQHT